MAQSLKEKIIEAIRTEDAGNALDLAKQLRQILDTKNPEEPDYRALEKLWAQLRFLSQRFYSEKSVIELYGKYPVYMLELPEETNLRELLDSRLRIETLNDDRARIKESIRKALITSSQRLGASEITLGTSQVPPTVENWIKAFVSVLDSSEKVSSVGVARFFSSNRDYNNLPAKEKKMLRRLIELYKYLLISPDDVEGYVEYDLVNVGKDGLLFVGGGKVEQIEDDAMLDQYEQMAKNNELSALELGQLQIQYPDRFNKYAKRDIAEATVPSTPEAVQQQMNTFLAEQENAFGNGSLTKLPVRQELILPFVQSLDIGSSAAPLQLFLDKLRGVLSNERSMIEFLNNKGAREMVRDNAPEHFNDPDVESIIATPYSPMALQALLEVILKAGYKLPEEEAQWHAYRLLQNLPPELKNYKTVITYDVAQNKLSWRY